MGRTSRRKSTRERNRVGGRRTGSFSGHGPFLLKNDNAFEILRRFFEVSTSPIRGLCFAIRQEKHKNSIVGDFVQL